MCVYCGSQCRCHGKPGRDLASILMQPTSVEPGKRGGSPSNKAEGHEERIALYAARAKAKRPLFDPRR